MAAAGADVLGKHLLAELHDCGAARLDDADFLRAECLNAARGMGATVVGDHVQRYGALGVSVVVILAESHLTLHTWPELGAASLGIFVCGEAADPARARDHIVRVLQAGRVTELSVRRP